MSVLVAITAAEDMKAALLTKKEKQLTSSHQIQHGSATPKEKSVYYGDDLVRDQKRLHFDSRSQNEDADPSLVVLDALAASGLRGLRYSLEVPYVVDVHANDFDESALQSMERNVKLNGIDPSHFITNRGDASFYMHSTRNSHLYFNMIDLDPYGTAAPFLDAAIQSLADGGLLSVTCTDMGVLAGNHVDTCFNKYGVIPHKANLPPCLILLQAIRILLSSIAMRAAVYGKYIHPLLSLSVDFYVRCFVRVYLSPTKSKETPVHLSHLYQCNSCPAFWTQPLAMKVTQKRSSSLQTSSCSSSTSHSQHTSTTGSSLFTENVGQKFHVSPGFPFILSPSLFDQATPADTDFQGSPAAPLCDRCPECCVGRIQIGGPIWSSPIHDHDFLLRMTQTLANSKESVEEEETDKKKEESEKQKETSTTEMKSEKDQDMVPAEDKKKKKKVGIFRTKKRMLGTLGVILRELSDCPLYYSYHDLCGFFSIVSPPPSTFVTYLLLCGCRVSQVHTGPTYFKTSASPRVVFDFFKHFVKEKMPARWNGLEEVLRESLKKRQMERKMIGEEEDETAEEKEGFGDKDGEEGEECSDEVVEEGDEQERTEGKVPQEHHSDSLSSPSSTTTSSSSASLAPPFPTRSQQTKEARVPALHGILLSPFATSPFRWDLVEQEIYTKEERKGNVEKEKGLESGDTAESKKEDADKEKEKANEDEDEETQKYRQSLREAKHHMQSVMGLVFNAKGAKSPSNATTSFSASSSSSSSSAPFLPPPRFITAEKGFGPKAKAHKQNVSEARLKRIQEKVEAKKAARAKVREEYAKVYGEKAPTPRKKTLKRAEQSQTRMEIDPVKGEKEL